MSDAAPAPPSGTAAEPPATPAVRPAAAYITAPEVAARAGQAAAAKPPLQEDDLDGLVARFEADLRPHPQAAFDPIAWVRHIDSLNESSGVRPQSGRESEPGYSIVNVNNRPAWDEMYFFLDPTTLGEKKPTARRWMQILLLAWPPRPMPAYPAAMGRECVSVWGLRLTFNVTASTSSRCALGNVRHQQPQPKIQQRTVQLYSMCMRHVCTAITHAIHLPSAQNARLQRQALLCSH